MELVVPSSHVFQCIITQFEVAWWDDEPPLGVIREQEEKLKRSREQREIKRER